MAFPKGKSKKIIIDGIIYNYCVSGKYSEDEGYHCIDIYVTNPIKNSKSHFELVFKRRDTWCNSANDYNSNAKLPITPSFIEGIIRSNNI